MDPTEDLRGRYPEIGERKIDGFVCYRGRYLEMSNSVAVWGIYQGRHRRWGTPNDAEMSYLPLTYPA